MLSSNVKLFRTDNAIAFTEKEKNDYIVRFRNMGYDEITVQKVARVGKQYFVVRAKRSYV